MITAILPMLGQSRRLPGKNRRLLDGRPLFHHILSVLDAVPDIGEILVTSDDDALLKAAAATSERVRIHRRAPEVSHPDTSMNRVLRDVVDALSIPDQRLLLQTHATSPLLRPQTIAAAIQAFRAARPRCDSLFSVTRRQVRLWDIEARPLNHDPERLLPTQDLAPVLEENSALYLFTGQGLRQHGRRIGAVPMPWETPPLESIDIDTADDFALAEAVLARRGSTAHQADSFKQV